MPWFRESQTLNDPLPPQSLTLRRGDRLPAFAASLEDGRGVIIDLTDAAAFMTLRPLRAGVAQPAHLVRLPLVIESAVGGFVSYDWQYTDTANAPASEYDVIVEVEYASGLSITLPTQDMGVIVNIRPSISSGYFAVDSSGALVPDGDGGYVVA